MYIPIIIKEKEAINLSRGWGTWEVFGGEEMRGTGRRKGKGGSDFIVF